MVGELPRYVLRALRREGRERRSATRSFDLDVQDEGPKEGVEISSYTIGIPSQSARDVGGKTRTFRLQPSSGMVA